MKESFIAIVPGIIIYTVVFIAMRFILTQLWKTSQVLARFFQDSERGQTISREAAYRLNISASEEPSVYARLTRSVPLVTWFRHLLIGTSLVFVPVTTTAIVRPQLVAEHYRNLVFVASGVHVLSATISYVLVRKNEQLVTTASDRREY